MEILSKLKPDIQAIRIARQIHEVANAQQTFLFGSRARGDHRPDSDIDVLVIKGEPQPESWLESLRQLARAVQKTQMPEASGIDIICMTEPEFTKGRVLRNHIANNIIASVSIGSIASVVAGPAALHVLEQQLGQQLRLLPGVLR